MIVLARSLLFILWNSPKSLHYFEILSGSHPGNLRNGSLASPIVVESGLVLSRLTLYYLRSQPWKGDLNSNKWVAMTGMHGTIVITKKPGPELTDLPA